MIIKMTVGEARTLIDIGGVYVEAVLHVNDATETTVRVSRDALREALAALPAGTPTDFRLDGHTLWIGHRSTPGREEKALQDRLSTPGMLACVIWETPTSRRILRTHKPSDWESARLWLRNLVSMWFTTFSEVADQSLMGFHFEHENGKVIETVPYHESN